MAEEWQRFYCVAFTLLSRWSEQFKVLKSSSINGEYNILKTLSFLGPFQVLIYTFIFKSVALKRSFYWSYLPLKMSYISKIRVSFKNVCQMRNLGSFSYFFACLFHFFVESLVTGMMFLDTIEILLVRELFWMCQILKISVRPGC